jgi:hypothetical protein
MCYFTTFTVNDQLIHAREWLKSSFMSMLREPLIFIDRRGVEHRVTTENLKPVHEDFVLWKGADIYEKFKPRELGMFGEHNHLAEVTKVHLAARSKLISSGGRKEAEMKQYVGRDGRLTGFGKEQVQTLGRRYKELSTEQIIELLPRSVRKIPEGVIRAHIAVGRRKKK